MYCVEMKKDTTHSFSSGRIVLLCTLRLKYAFNAKNNSLEKYLYK